MQKSPASANNCTCKNCFKFKLFKFSGADINLSYRQNQFNAGPLKHFPDNYLINSSLQRNFVLCCCLLSFPHIGIYLTRRRKPTNHFLSPLLFILSRQVSTANEEEQNFLQDRGEHLLKSTGFEWKDRAEKPTNRKAFLVCADISPPKKEKKFIQWITKLCLGLPFLLDISAVTSTVK